MQLGQRTVSEQRAFERSAGRGAILREMAEARAEQRAVRAAKRAARKARWQALVRPAARYTLRESTVGDCWPSAIAELHTDSGTELVAAPGAYRGESIDDVFARGVEAIAARHTDGSRWRVKTERLG